MRNLIVGLGIIGLMTVGASAQGRHWGHKGNWNNGAYNNYNVPGYHPPVNGTYNWNNGNPYQNGNNGNYNYNYNYNNGYNNGYYNNSYYNNNGYYNNGNYRRNNTGRIINGLLNRRW
ncbi:MAG: hypothetical protein J0I12_17765 [Candidatus Eremiobacteraeota bacterium]|nr:hypothetical protein [Candidatus Eremiobacteraeota bacterium]